jgi:hypothetical protein
MNAEPRTSTEAPKAGRFLGGAEPFVLTAMLSLLGGNIWLFQERELLLGHFYRPELLSITHTLTLGWITMLMMGVLVQISPRAAGVQIRSRRLLRVQFWLMIVGYLGMVFHFWVSGFLAMALAAIFIVAAAAVQLVQFSGTFRRSRGEDWLPRYISGAMINFLGAAVVGVLLGFDKVYEVIGGQFFPNIFAHAHLAALGWVTLMIVGFEHRLLPTSKPAATRPYEAAVRFWLLEIGVVGLVASLFLVSRWTPLFAGMIVAALWMHAWRPLWTALRNRVQDRATLWATVALVFLIGDTVAGLLLSLGIPPPTSVLRTRLQFAYGYSGLLGWTTLTIVAQAYKLLPMFVWEDRFRRFWGKEPVPAMRDLYSKPLQTLSGAFMSVGTAGVIAGILTNTLPLLTIFQGIVVIGVAAFLLNFFLIARWSLLKKAFHPTAEDWENFYSNFPSARAGDGP